MTKHHMPQIISSSAPATSLDAPLPEKGHSFGGGGSLNSRAYWLSVALPSLDPHLLIPFKKK